MGAGINIIIWKYSISCHKGPVENDGLTLGFVELKNVYALQLFKFKIVTFYLIWQ